MQSLSFSQWLFLEENIRDQNRFQDINDRVKYGKDMEYKIVQTLRSKGWEIVEPSNKQDKSDKIDGTLMRSSDPIPVTLPAPIQVKYRDTGDDILMEVVREFDYDYTRPAESILTGRDMIGKAKIYVSLNRDGNVIRIRSADQLPSP